MLEDILLIIGGLAGLGGFISMLINLLKKVKVIKDGDAEKWYQGISLVVFVAVTIVYFTKITVDWSQVDGWLALLTTALGFVVQLFGGQVTYKVMQGTPLFGFSYSKSAERSGKTVIDDTPVG